jgi:hypothetical protein
MAGSITGAKPAVADCNMERNAVNLRPNEWAIVIAWSLRGGLLLPFRGR